MNSNYKRIVGNILINEGSICRTRNFIPDYNYTHNFLDSRYFDELTLIDVSKKSGLISRAKYLEKVSELIDNSTLPITLGGNLRNKKDIDYMFTFGADRVLIGKNLLLNESHLRNSVSTHGSQAIIFALDFDSKLLKTSKEYQSKLVEDAKRVIDLGVGEILLNATDRDGMLRGLDTFAPELLHSQVGVPLIICGGLGNWEHLANALRLDSVSGVGTSNILHLTSQAVLSAKHFLTESNIPVRMPWAREV